MASVGQASMHRVQPMHQASSTKATLRGLTLRHRLRVGRAVRVAAAGALGLRQRVKQATGHSGFAGLAHAYLAVVAFFTGALRAGFLPTTGLACSVAMSGVAITAAPASATGSTGASAATTVSLTAPGSGSVVAGSSGAAGAACFSAAALVAGFLGAAALGVAALVAAGAGAGALDGAAAVSVNATARGALALSAAAARAATSADAALGLANSWPLMKALTSGYTCSRQRRPEKMP